MSGGRHRPTQERITPCVAPSAGPTRTAWSTSAVRGRWDDPPSARLRGLVGWPSPSSGSRRRHCWCSSGTVPGAVRARQAGLRPAEGLQEPAHPREEILRIASDIEEAIRARGQREVESQEVGIELLNALRDLDPVAYMRFASVYKDFQDLPTSSASWRTSACARPLPEAAFQRPGDVAGGVARGREP